MKQSLRRIGALGGGAAMAAALVVVLTGATGSPLASPLARARTAKPETFNKAVAARFIRSSLRQLKTGGPMRVVRVIHGSGIHATTSYSSTNWSGWAVDNSGGNTYTAVKANLVVPTTVCPAVSGYSLAAFWVGLDGFNNSTVEQDGTISECHNGSYLGDANWWEMYPANAIQIGNTVTAGDHISASVVFNAKGKYVLKVVDHTATAANLSKTQACTSGCANASAEWIGEAPCCSSGSQVYPLNNFGKWKVTGAKATSAGVSNPISFYPNDVITMVNSTNTHPLATPSALNSTGTSFTDKWNAAS